MIIYFFAHFGSLLSLIVKMNAYVMLNGQSDTIAEAALLAECSARCSANKR
jgi:hypothetical protein